MKNNKSLGQHWLKNQNILNQIASLVAERSAYKNSEICVEIGPGLGTLTASLFKYFDQVIAVEYDFNLAKNLPKSFPGKNLDVINMDILDYSFDEINKPYVVAGNIPYYMTSPIIKKLLTTKKQPQRIVLLIQKEVAERITSDKETKLSLFVKNYANITSGPIVKKAEFTPPPKVDSQVIIMDPHPPIVEDAVFSLIQLGFNSPRKKLTHNLAAIKPKNDLVQALSRLNINPDARPGDLSLLDWQNLNHILTK